MDVCKKIVVSGRVQGVFFRQSTRQLALELKLVGGVRNLPDGRVEVQVSGQTEAVQSLINWLKIGPKYANVSTIEVQEIKAIRMQAEVEFGRHTKSFEVWPSR